MKKTLEHKNALGLRLTGYVASAGALALVGSSSHAQVIHSGPMDLELNMPTEQIEIDLDGDLVSDFGFNIYGSHSFSSSAPYFRYRNSGVGIIFNARTDGVDNSWMIKSDAMRLFQATYSTTMSATNPVDIPADLEAGEPINSLAASWSNSPVPIIQGILAFRIEVSYYYGSTAWGYGGYYAGAFAGKTRFIGTRFHIGADTHYGWIRISMGDKINPMRILDWAYEANPGVGLEAGEGGDLTGPVLSLIGVETTTPRKVITLAITANEEIQGLELSDFQVSNGTALNLKTLTPGRVYTLEVQASAFGMVTVNVPEGAMSDRYGNSNGAETISWEYIDAALGLQTDDKEGLSVYPNPANQILNVELDTESSVQLVNLSGKLILQQGPMLFHHLDVRGVPPGIYILRIQNPQKLTQHKVIIE